MSAPETPAKPAQDHPSLWQRSLWPLVLYVALPIFAFGLIVEHWFPLEGRLALVANFGIGGAAGLTVFLIIEKSRNLMRQRREAEAAAGGSGSC